MNLDMVIALIIIMMIIGLFLLFANRSPLFRSNGLPHVENRVCTDADPPSARFCGLGEKCTCTWIITP